MERQASGSTWSSFWAPPLDVPGLVLKHFDGKDKKGFRGASANSRTAVNAGVTKAVIDSQDDLQRLADLKLHERFPNLASIVLTDGPSSDSSKVVRSIVDFVVVILSKLPSLSSVDLTSCRELDTAGAALALASCTNLSEVRMPDDGNVTNVTLQLLAQITSLTRLVLNNNVAFDAAGLQHLSSLRKLQSLECNNCPGITDASITALAQLKGLTSLELCVCSIQGSTLAQLSALSNLQQLTMPILDANQHLTALQSLTSLTKLELQDDATTDACKGILELPALQHLEACGIYLEGAPTASMCRQLTSLISYDFSQTVALLPPLPELQPLRFQYTPMDDVMPRQQLVAAIASQTSLTRLDMSNMDDGYGLVDDDIVTMLAPLKQLQELDATFNRAMTSGSIAAFQAIAALPELRVLGVGYATDTQHLALLHRCAKLEQLSVSSMEVQAGTLATLVCKLGMRKVCVSYVKGFDQEALQAVADSVGVELVVR